MIILCPPVIRQIDSMFHAVTLKRSRKIRSTSVQVLFPIHLKYKDIFGERQKDGTGIQFIYESDGRLINSAQITGNVTDKEELTLLETVEGFGRLVHSIGVSVETDRPEETAEFVFQMYWKKGLAFSGSFGAADPVISIPPELLSVLL